MHRKHFIGSLFLCGGIIYLLTSGSISIRSGASSAVPVIVTSPLDESLTGTLLISPGGAHRPTLGVLEEAKYSIDIRGYQITDKDLIAILLHKAKSGVKIRIILENSMHGNESDDYFSFYQQIKGSGIDVKSDEGLGTNYVHAKTFIIDREKFIVSTANSTYPGFFSNREYWFVGKQKNYAELLSNIFVADRNNNHTTIQLPSNVRICPFNCREELTKLIDEATTNIDIQAQYLEDPLLIQQLQQKVKEGVTVRLIFGKYQEDTIPPDLKSYTRIQSDPNVHAKNILIDKKKLYIGSMNLSTNAIEKNREIGVVTEDKYVVDKFMKQFIEDRDNRSNAY